MHVKKLYCVLGARQSWSHVIQQSGRQTSLFFRDTVDYGELSSPAEEPSSCPWPLYRNGQVGARELSPQLRALAIFAKNMASASHMANL